MDEFRTIARLWPSGVELSQGTDSNLLGGAATFTRDAPIFVTSPDGTQNFEFRFWNTGRHTTSKRRVRWNFSVLGWGTWTATRWYGPPAGGNGGGDPHVRADPFSIATDGPLLPGGTPIDGAASTFAAGAWPFNGDDHVIGTAAGPASVVAKDPFDNADFAGWLQMIVGGDPVGEFVESDSGTGGVIGGTGFYDHVVGGAFLAAQGTSAELLATYGASVFTIPDPFGPLRDLFDRYRHLGGPGSKIPPNVDPAPPDLIRLLGIEQLLALTRPGGGAGTDFGGLIEAVPRMSNEELKQAQLSVQTTLDLGKSALASINAQLKREM